MKKKLMFSGLFFLVVFAGFSLSVAVEVEENFEEGIGGWVLYREGDDVRLSHCPAESYAGDRSLLVETPGAKGTEGVRKSFTVPSLERYRVSVMARGRGTVRLAAYDQEWIYGSRIELKDEWQKMEISVFVRGSRITPTIYTPGVQRAEFHLDHLVIEREALPGAPGKEVAGVKFEAEDFPPPARIIEDPSASGGAYREGTRWHYMADGIPHPRTALPVYIYIRAWVENHESNYLEIRHTGPGRQFLAGMRLDGSKQWEWVKAGPFVQGEILETFSVRHDGASEKKARVDCIVVSTHDNLEPAVLDGIPRADTPGRALVKASRAARPPVIDGKLDDEAWRGAIEITSFILIGETGFAEDGTRAYLAYDESRLYVAFHNEQFALDPANNILHEFKAETTEDNNDDIFQDDYAVILLSAGEDATYDIFMNAAGAVSDARGTGRNPWRDRDKGWSSEAEVAAGIYEGYWVVEAAIPFDSLGVSPGEVDMLRLGLGRRSRQQEERSAWTPMSAGFHAPEEFGELVLGEDVPGIRNVHHGDLSRGANLITGETFPGQAETLLRIQSLVAPVEGDENVQFTDYLISENRKFEHRYGIEIEGHGSFSYSIMNAADFSVYYRSPDYRFSVQSSVLKAGNMRGEDYRIYLNGEEIDHGASLYPGVNILAVETEGKMYAEFEVGDYRFSTGGGWRYSDSAPAGWAGREYSDADWEQTISDSGGMIGRSGERGYYRRVLLVNHSKFWPNWEMEGLWVAENSIQEIFLFPQGVEGYVIEDYNFYMEVPEEFKVIGASSYYNRLPSLGVRLQGSLERGAEKYSRYLIHAADAISRREPENIPMHHLVSVAIELPESGGEFKSRDAGPFYYYLEAEGGTITEVPRSLRVNVLPPLRGKQPQKYMWRVNESWLNRMTDENLQGKIYGFLRKAGFNVAGVPSSPHEGTGLNYLRFIDFNSWNIDMRPYLEKNPAHALLDNEGVRRYMPGDGTKNHACTTLLLNDTPAWKFAEETLVDLIRRLNPPHVAWNYEANVWGSYLACYDERCLDEFREFAGIGAHVELDPGTIRRDYPARWTRFMNIRMAELAGRLREAARKADPQAVFSVYSGYQSERTRDIYGVDWSLLSGKIDVAMCGYGRPVAELRNTLEALGNTPLVTGVIVRPYRVTNRQYPGYVSKARLLRRAVDATGGVLFYKLSSFGGRTFYASAEISRLVAEYEDIFVADNRRDDLIDVSGISMDEAAVLAGEKTMLVLLMNESGSSRDVRVINRAFRGGMRGFDYFEGVELEDPRSIEAVIPANGVKVFIITEK